MRIEAGLLVQETEKKGISEIVRHTQVEGEKTATNTQ